MSRDRDAFTSDLESIYGEALALVAGTLASIDRGRDLLRLIATHRASDVVDLELHRIRPDGADSSLEVPHTTGLAMLGWNQSFSDATDLKWQVITLDVAPTGAFEAQIDYADLSSMRTPFS